MRKNGLIILSLVLVSLQASDQPGHFDVFTYQSPEFFAKTELSSRVQFNLKNSDTSFCSITMYKSKVMKGDTNFLRRQWSEYVVKGFTRADKNPQQVMTGKEWDGWTSTLAIGNFYQKKKKCVVMLNSFTKGNLTACVVFALSDKSFKYPVETFSQQLHLNDNK